ncbi:MAG TPA: hypothetical protein VG938_00700 [Verrucomicrobiae bacterium]|jgi:hypothetical protein|nr:hypothetical protein [Verrucomicrobiae bacterium]
MKHTFESVWRTQLNDTDWNFSRCPSAEVSECLHWELHRERVQIKNSGKFPNELKYEPTAAEWRSSRFLCNRDETIPQMLQRLGREPKGKWVKAAWPSYLEKRRRENWALIETPKPMSWEWLDIDWGSYFYQNWDDLYEIVRTLPRRHLWIGGEDQVEVCPLSISWNRRDEELVGFFRDWLLQNRPKGDDDRPRVDEPISPAKKKGGAGDPIRQAKTKLKALAAWRLLQHYRGNRVKAYAHIGAEKFLGRQFQNASAWSEARSRLVGWSSEFDPSSPSQAASRKL